MEWTTVIVSVLTSGVVVGIFAFTIKKYVESAIKARFDEQLERQKSVLSVDTEKRKVVTQSQVDTYREALGLVYRIRNSCRELREKLTENRLTREELVKHSKLNPTLIELL